MPTDPILPPPRFIAVPVRARRDGWTPAAQHAFIAALAQCGSVPKAARVVGRSAVSAYKLRSRPHAEPFARAWDIVVSETRDQLVETVMRHALHGEAVPVIREGHAVGTRLRFDDRSAMNLFRRAGLGGAPGYFSTK